MNKGYWVVAYRSVADEVALKAYGKLAEQAIAANGGSILLRSATPVAQENGLEERTVVVEFASFELAQQVYAGEAYQLALRTLGSGADRDFRIVEGVAQPA
jgi:uncharacterized protein (DUF1330 family)